MKESLGVRFLYRTVIGRSILKLLVKPKISRAAGKFLDTSFSRILIAPFRLLNGISLDGIAVPKGGFPSFNAFFSRKRKSVSFDMNPEHLCSPCDGYLSSFPINEDSCFEVKHSRYSLAGLLRNPKLAREFQGGTAMIFRLTPADYHRYSYVDNGEVLGVKKLPGILHCVRPAAIDTYPVYVQNSREYTVIESENFGRMVQMEVGALLVGRIRNHRKEKWIYRSEEKGYFEYGGSTIILLFKKDRVEINDPVIRCVSGWKEFPVKQGEWIATKKE